MMVMLAAALLAADVEAEGVMAPKTQKEKLSYTIGADTGKALRQQEFDVDPEFLIRGLKDGLSGDKLLMTDTELQATRTATQGEMMRKQAAQKQKAGEDNKKAGEAFLAENRKKEGVVALPSGLQYRILKSGDGKKPTDADTVECHYRGTLINGTEFDSSYARGNPATFGVKGVIPGWTEALKMMPVGSKWQLFIPSELAYGSRGAGRQIGPNETLVFEVELLGIK